MMPSSEDAIIYLRLSDFRDDDDITFTERAAELLAFAAEELGIPADRVRVVTENDVNGNGRPRSASAYKTPVAVRTPDGLVTFRTRRPEFASALLDLQAARARVFIASDISRICRDHRDAYDLIDACRKSGASVVTPGDDGKPRWVLTRGGTPDEISAFKERANDAARYSAEIAAKVAKGRKRWAGKSYQGGRRPFGYRHDADAPQHRKRLLVVEAEAQVIRNTAAAILDFGASLAGIARDLRAGDVPTVTGVPWSAEILKDVLIKPAVAGIAVHTSEITSDGEVRKIITEHQAPWPAILDPDVWRRLRSRLTDPGRRTTTANAPRWLGSGIYRCHCGGNVHVSGGRDKGPGYVCDEGSHLRRKAAAVDAHVTRLLLVWIMRDGAGLLPRPEPRRGADAAALQAEAKRLDEQRKAHLRRNTQGLITDTELDRELRYIKARQDAIAAQLAESATDELAGLRAGLNELHDAPDPLAAWKGLSLERQRAIVRELATVTLLRSTRRGSGFDPDSVRIEPRHAGHDND